MSTVDWGLARQVAQMIHGAPTDADREPLPGDPAGTAVAAIRPITEYTGLVPQASIPPAESVDRAVWTQANIEMMGSVLDPLASRIGDGLGPFGGVAKVIGGSVIGAEAGALAGWLASRVLGQYDIRLLDPPPGAAIVAPRLLLVAPNLRKSAVELDVDLERLVRWVTVHEVTHAVQFTGVPWLREHLAGMLRELLAVMELKSESTGLSIPSRDELRAMIEAVRKGELTALAGASGGDIAGFKEKLDRIQATMALIEGHAEHVMDAVGEQILGDLTDLRSALDRRRSNRPAVLAFIEKILGLELKMRQYVIGRKFCDAVIEKRDVATLHRAFSAPEMLPTLAELSDADAWLARIEAAA